jgi:hypothetical protein
VKIKIVCVLLCAFAALFFDETLQAQGTTFTYQGQLNSNNSPASGLYDFTFTMFNTSDGVSPATLTLTNSAVAVTNGLFTTVLDFGSGIFTGTNYWLEIGVRATGTTNFTTLSPRQLLTPAPYAIFANATSNLLGSLLATQLSGALPSAQLSGTYSGALNFNNGANSFSGSFNGNGSSLSNLNASQLTSGTVADARLSANVALLNANQTFTGANTFTNLYGNSFSGSFFGNGLVGWIATNATAFQAQIDHGYLLTNSQVVTVTLPASPNIADIVRIAGAGAGGWQIAQNVGQSVLGNFSSFAQSSWLLTSASRPQNWISIASSSDGGELIASAYGVGIYISENSGATWTLTNSTPGWRSVACSSDGGKLFAALYGNGIYTNSSNGWGIGGSTSGLNWISVACSSDGGKLVAAVNGGGIYTSTNSGSTWKQQTSGLPSASTHPNWYCVASSANGSNLVAVVNGGGIYTSANAGATWGQQTAGLPGSADWISIASSADGTKLAAVVYGGGIYTSINAGANWTQQTAGVPANSNWTAITSSADGSRLAAVIDGGGIYHSSNSGLTWTQTGAPVNNWYSIVSSSDGGGLAAGIDGGGIYTSQSSSQITTTTVGTNGYITGGQGSAVELQYIGNNQFMPVSSAGTIWAH